jgi:hypothetical protein
MSFADARLEVRGISVSYDVELRERFRDLAGVVGGKFDGCRAEVFFQAMQLGGAGDRHDPWFLRQQPSKSDLRRGDTFGVGDLCQGRNEGLVGLEVLRLEARDDAAL